MGKIVSLFVVRRLIISFCILAIGKHVPMISFGQEIEGYTHLHKSSKLILRYKYFYKNDSLFMQGVVLERKTSLPAININITIIADQIGTVPDQRGEFTLYLEKSQGVIRFDKTQFDKFDLLYNSRSIR